MASLEKLRGGLVVSCQPVDGGPMDHPDIVAAMAEAAVAGGASGLRIEGVENLRTVRSRVSVPIIAIIKRDRSDTPVRITPEIEDVAALADAGADVIAYDGTSRVRPVPAPDILAAIHARGLLAMADCSTLADTKAAVAGGVQIIGTTLSGYTDETTTGTDEPDLELVRQLNLLDVFVMAEGRYNSPDRAAAAIRAGADSVTVGSAITRLEHITTWFRDSVRVAS
jgi:N-acylglucosamine-6-phosphate 2-epimerase